jgi:hypothetical protein
MNARTTGRAPVGCQRCDGDFDIEITDGHSAFDAICPACCGARANGAVLWGLATPSRLSSSATVGDASAGSRRITRVAGTRSRHTGSTCLGRRGRISRFVAARFAGLQCSRSRRCPISGDFVGPDSRCRHTALERQPRPRLLSNPIGTSLMSYQPIPAGCDPLARSGLTRRCDRGSPERSEATPTAWPGSLLLQGSRWCGGTARLRRSPLGPRLGVGHNPEGGQHVRQSSPGRSDCPTLAGQQSCRPRRRAAVWQWPLLPCKGVEDVARIRGAAPLLAPISAAPSLRRRRTPPIFRMQPCRQCAGSSVSGPRSGSRSDRALGAAPSVIRRALTPLSCRSRAARTPGARGRRNQVSGMRRRRPRQRNARVPLVRRSSHERRLCRLAYRPGLGTTW